MTDKTTQHLQAKIFALEERLKDVGAIASRTIILEHNLHLARAAIADLKHKLFLIGSEASIQAAIAEHSVGIFIKSTKPVIGIANAKTKRKGRARAKANR